MRVSRSGYYGWLDHKCLTHQNPDEDVMKAIKEIFSIGRCLYGSRRIKRELIQRGFSVSRRRIGRLMKEAGLFCRIRRKFKVTTDSKHNKPISPNVLNREFAPISPNQCWVGDITYVKTGKGWMYLAVVLDLYSRQVVGWSMQNHMRSDLVNDALLMAIWKRKPSKGLILHTDQGSQYASESHRAIIKNHGITQSMSRKGNCWDNAVAESFFHTIKTELIHNYKFKDQEEAKHVIFEYIEVFYNRIRIHSANGYLSPVKYESIKKCS